MQMQQPPKITTSDIEITKDDQLSINNFSRLHMIVNDKSKILVANKEELNQLDDCLTELELADEDETIRMKYGDCFFHVKAEPSKVIIE